MKNQNEGGLVAPQQDSVFVNGELTISDVKDMAIASARTQATGLLRKHQAEAGSLRKQIVTKNEEFTAYCAEHAKKAAAENGKVATEALTKFFGVEVLFDTDVAANGFDDKNKTFRATFTVGIPGVKSNGYHSSGDRGYSTSMSRTIEIKIDEVGEKLDSEITSLEDQLQAVREKITELERFIDRDIFMIQDAFVAQVVGERLKNTPGGEKIVAAAADIFGSSSIQGLLPESLREALCPALGTSESNNG